MNLRVILWSLSIVVIGFLSMILWSSYQYYVMIHADDPVSPSLSVTTGEAKIIRGDIAIELMESESYDLMEGDAIETGGESLALVTWPDHSITRLGPLTRIVIHRMLATEGYEHIEVSFTLKKGKIWSNVVRAMIGDSYFETRLPRNDIVAGVRGTIYEINLENRYIHAVNHAVSLGDKSGKSLLLMPGELVDSEDIWIRRSLELLDTTWGSLNTAKDALYKNERISALRNDIHNNTNILTKKYDQFVRWLLGHFDTFRFLTVQDLIERGDISKLSETSIEILTPYYQRVQSLGSTGGIDTLRSALYEVASRDPQELATLIPTLELGSLWDSLESGNMLPGAEKILSQSKQFGSNISVTEITGILTKKDLPMEIKSLFEKVLE